MNGLVATRTHRAVAPLRFAGVIAVIATCGGCSVLGGGDPGPLTPMRADDGTVFAVVAGLNVRPGQIEAFDAFVVNTSTSPITITSAQLVRVPGLRVATLERTGLEHGVNLIGIDRGWPPTDVQVTRLVGASLPPGRSNIAIGVAAHSPGIYAAAGLRLIYRYRGTQHSGTAWGGAVTCVATGSQGEASRSCRPGEVAAAKRVSDFLHEQ